MKKSLSIAALMFAMVLAAVATVYAAAPRKINYQGYLTNSSGVPLTGTYPMVFSLCDAATVGTCPWSESQSVAIDKGIFNVALGTVTPLGLSFNIPYYLDIQVNGEQMSARQPLTHVGYAFQADAATTAATATSFSGALSGDVTGSQGATVVSAVGGPTGVSTAQIVSGVNATNNATGTNTPGTIVKRDGAGNFAAGTVTANIIGNISGNAITATSFAANGSNCAAGQYARGVDASGNAEGCTVAGGGATIAFSGGTSNAKMGGANFYSANGQSLPNIYSDSVMNVVPMTCTAKNLYVTLYHWQAGDSGSYLVTLMLGTNGVQSPQILTCTVANTGAADTVTKCSDTSSTVSISAGSYISMRVDGSIASYSGTNGPEMAWGFICQ